MPVTAEEQDVLVPATRLLAWQVTATPVMVGRGVSVISADADLVLSCTLVAVMTTEFPVVGAVSTPAGEIAPADAAKVTAFEILPVPVTVGEQVVELPATIVVGRQATDTAVTVGGELSGMVTEPDLVESAVLVAVTVMDDASRDAGAVSTPVELIVPREADQVTADE